MRSNQRHKEPDKLACEAWNAHMLGYARTRPCDLGQSRAQYVSIPSLPSLRGDGATLHKKADRRRLAARADAEVDARPNRTMSLGGLNRQFLQLEKERA